MTDISRRTILAGAGAAALLPAQANAATREEIDQRVETALQLLFAQRPGAQDLFNRSRGVLVMPAIREAGLFFGGAYGEGSLLIDGVPVAYYSVAVASFGLQIGAQFYRQAIFFLTDDALRGFRMSDGWELAAEAEVAGDGEGYNLNVSTQLSGRPIIAVTFGQDGAMISASLEGAKYSLIPR
ncbi:MAG: twin-arginine translocation pathway signal [Rubricella sp.]